METAWLIDRSGERIHSFAIPDPVSVLQYAPPTKFTGRIAKPEDFGMVTVAVRVFERTVWRHKDSDAIVMYLEKV